MTYDCLAPCEYCEGRPTREIWTATERGWRVRLICRGCEGTQARRQG